MRHGSKKAFARFNLRPGIVLHAVEHATCAASFPWALFFDWRAAQVVAQFLRCRCKLLDRSGEHACSVPRRRGDRDELDEQADRHSVQG